MQARLLGLQDIEFTNPDGKKVKGKNTFAAFVDERVEGMRCERFFLKEGISLPKETKINDLIDIAFDYKGRVIGIQKMQ